LAERALKHIKFSYDNPKVINDEAKENNDGNADGDDDGIQEELENKELPEDDIGEPEKGKGDVKHGTEDDDEHNIIQSKINAEEWQKECERVSSRLKIQSGLDTKEWRTHLEQAKTYSEKVKEYLPEARGKLEKTSDELLKIMEKISGKEKVINKNFAHIIEEYKVHAENLKDVRQKSDQLNDNNQKQLILLNEITDKLEVIQNTMNVAGNTMTDTSPLFQIKKAIHSLRQEIQGLEIRIGVVSNTLLQAKLKEKSSQEPAKMNSKPERLS
jgi:estrogen-related receptor beta like 1